MINIRTKKLAAFHNWRSFISCFCRTEAQVSQCIDILQTIINKENNFSAHDWGETDRTSVGMYTKCMKLLRENGLIEKDDNHYRLSHELIISLEIIIGKWTVLIDKIESGEKIALERKKISIKQTEARQILA